MPGRRNLGPIRESRPIPRATCSTLASAASHRFETALMNEIFSARKAFEACLMISALLVEVCSSGGRLLRRAAAGNGVRPLVVLAFGQGRVDRAQQFGRAFAIGAHDDPIGMQEILHRCAFAQKLGIGDDVERIATDSVALDHPANPLVGVDRDRALFDDDLVTIDGAGDLAGHCLHIGQVSIAGLRLGRSNRDKDGLAGARGFTEVGHKTHPGIAISLQQLGQVLLVDERVAGLERGYLALVVVHADHRMTHLRKTYRGDQADVS